MTPTNLKIEYPDVMDLRIAALFLGMSEGRLRTLVREEKVKGARDEESQKWTFKRTDLEAYLKEPKARAASNKATKAGKAFINHLTIDKLQRAKDALAAIGVELEQRYDYSKQRAYQQKRKAAKAAAKKVAVPATPVSKQ